MKITVLSIIFHKKTMMQKLRITLLSFLIVGFSSLAWSQIDVSISPLAAIVSQNVKANVEFGTSEIIGIELNGTINTNSSSVGVSLGKGFTLGVIGKYYFNPNLSRSNFYVGPYFRYIEYEPLDDLGSNLQTFKRGKAGIFGGYKVVSAKNIVFEFGLGLGTRLFNNFTDDINLPGFDITGKIAVGYRFGGENSGSSGNSSRNKMSDDDKMTQDQADDRRKSSKKKGKKKKKRGSKSRT